MTYEVVMPQLGLTMEEGSVVSWKKQVGDRVTKGEVLFTVETDKTEMEVESTDTGYLNALQVRLGEKVRVGTVIALLGDRPGEVAIIGGATASEASIDAGANGAANSQPFAQAGLNAASPGEGGFPAQAVSASEIPASPRARRLAKELGIDINAVKPAQGKRIVEEDVRRFHESSQGGRSTGEGGGS
jgi:pyruvate dehydrogenase E2 component (dihydrolipoamide acetyltransferase)